MDDLYADPVMWPAGSADGPRDAYQPTGIKTVAQAIKVNGKEVTWRTGFAFLRPGI